MGFCRQLVPSITIANPLSEGPYANPSHDFCLTPYPEAHPRADYARLSAKKSDVHGHYSPADQVGPSCIKRPKERFLYWRIRVKAPLLTGSRPRALIESARISTLRILPVTVIGNVLNELHVMRHFVMRNLARRKRLLRASRTDELRADQVRFPLNPRHQLLAINRSPAPR